MFGDRVGKAAEVGEGGSLFEDVKICGYFRREEDQVRRLGPCCRNISNRFLRKETLCVFRLLFFAAILGDLGLKSVNLCIFVPL